jgi:hypothetical protein
MLLRVVAHNTVESTRAKIVPGGGLVESRASDVRGNGDTGAVRELYRFRAGPTL